MRVYVGNNDALRGGIMPRANRCFLPNHIWHITHRCHEKAFLLKFARDRRRYLRWLFEAKKRFGLCVLNYIVTSNHIHLLVKDTEKGAIAQSMQLIAGRIGQEYNARKQRKGAFWEDRYHATAVESGEHLQRCLVYIDLNMVRAGVVRHPAAWEHGGYHEIQNPRERYALVMLEELSALCGFKRLEAFQSAHRQWVDDALAQDAMRREERWSEAIAVGSREFVERVKTELEIGVRHGEVEEEQGAWVLREPQEPYRRVFDGKNDALRLKNGFLWRESRAYA
jgi:REP element-mobilizing transposase RayT